MQYELLRFNAKFQFILFEPSRFNIKSFNSVIFQKDSTGVNMSIMMNFSFFFLSLCYAISLSIYSQQFWQPF